MFSSLELSESVAIAIVSGLGGTTALVVKDILLPLLKSKKDERKNSLEVFWNYADPLSESAVSLFYRLKETLADGERGAYLLNNGAANSYELYKYTSTAYRLSALISWIRAFKRELADLNLEDTTQLASLRRSIEEFEKALSDGMHIERRRLNDFAAAWNIQLPDDTALTASLAVSLERMADEEIARRLPDGGMADQLGCAQRLEVCRRLADHATNTLKIDHVDEDLLTMSASHVVLALSIKEAWLYRDYQNGIGDLLIRETQQSRRRFEVIGFKDFETMILSGDDETLRWMRRIFEIIEGIDLSSNAPFDARIQLLEQALISVIDIIRSLAAIERPNRLVNETVLATAKSMQNDKSWQRFTS